MPLYLPCRSIDWGVTGSPLAGGVAAGVGDTENVRFSSQYKRNPNKTNMPQITKNSIAVANTVLIAHDVRELATVSLLLSTGMSHNCTCFAWVRSYGSTALSAICLQSRYYQSPRSFTPHTTPTVNQASVRFNVESACRHTLARSRRGDGGKLCSKKASFSLLNLSAWKVDILNRLHCLKI